MGDDGCQSVKKMKRLSPEMLSPPHGRMLVIYWIGICRTKERHRKMLPLELRRDCWPQKKQCLLPETVSLSAIA